METDAHMQDTAGPKAWPTPSFPGTLEPPHPQDLGDTDAELATVFSSLNSDAGL